MQRAHATPAELAALAPLAGLSPERLAELAELARVERVPRGADPLLGREARGSIFPPSSRSSVVTEIFTLMQL